MIVGRSKMHRLQQVESCQRTGSHPCAVVCADEPPRLRYEDRQLVDFVQLRSTPPLTPSGFFSLKRCNSIGYDRLARVPAAFWRVPACPSLECLSGERWTASVLPIEMVIGALVTDERVPPDLFEAIRTRPLGNLLEQGNAPEPVGNSRR
jgi:hypothetical protein